MTKTAIEIKEMQLIAVRLSVATAHCAIGVTMISGRVMTVTEKAVAIKLDTTEETVWFPKKALVSRREETGLSGCGTVVFCQLAHWFKADASTAYKIKKGFHSGMIAA